MVTENSGKYLFEMKGSKPKIFIEDEHDFPIMIDNATDKYKYYNSYEEAENVSDYLNSLKINGLVTRPIGAPWRIYLENEFTKSCSMD